MTSFSGLQIPRTGERWAVDRKRYIEWERSYEWKRKDYGESIKIAMGDS